ncbi:MAG: MmgE/PrpD family protein [Alphaproteobacteria bacterium]
MSAAQEIGDEVNPVETLAAHVVQTRFEDLPQEAVDAAKTFILDSIGVGVAGSDGPWARELIETVGKWGAGDESRVFVHGVRLPASSAAIVNAYQIHCLEYDCVNEDAVIHPMATILGAVSAEADRAGGYSGKDLILAVALGVDASCVLGVSSRAPMRFFRPSTAGAFGATAAVAKLRGLDEATLINAFGATYGQISGTLAPHREGSPVLGMQIGFCARGAISACDLAQAGLIGPHEVITGMYGYLPMYEGDYDHVAAFESLGKTWQITRVSHKPFPSGRLTHGVVDGIQQLRKREDLKPEEVERMVALVPPLAHRLTGRPDIPDPEPNYAKLCIPFVAATALLEGTVDVHHFKGDWLRNPKVHEIAANVEPVEDSNPDTNAVAPQKLEVYLKDGRKLEVDMPQIFGHPENPLSHKQNVAKFKRAWASAAKPLSEESADRMIDAVTNLEGVDDVRSLIDLTIA